MNTVYRKMRNGQEFMRITDNEIGMSVMITKYSSRIIVTVNSNVIESYTDDNVSVPSNKKEFDEKMKAALKLVGSHFKVK